MARFLALGAALSAFSCATLIEAPRLSGDGKAIAILDHGKHSSLLLPVGSDRMVRYSYGDWQYYALARTGVLQGSAALFWPSQAGMGRRELKGPISSSNIEKQVVVPIEEIFWLVVAPEEVENLRAHLDGIYESNRKSLIYNEAYDLEFVHHPDRYWVFHNSNQVMGDWLRRLGCKVRGSALFSSWRVSVAKDLQNRG